MQGKERNNSHIDTEFQDFAWSEMSALLDKEMPVATTPVKDGAPHKRYALFAALLLFGFLSGVGTMLLLEEKEKSNSPVEEPAKIKVPQKIAAQESDAIASISSAETDQLIVQQKNNQQVERLIQNTILNKSKTQVNVGNLYTNSSSVIGESFSSPKEIATNNNTSIIKQEEIADDIPVVKRKSPTTTIDQRAFDQSSNKPTSALTTLQAKNIEKSETPISLAYLPLNQKPKWSFGAFLSNHTRDWSGAHGWSAGLNTSYRMDDAFSLRVGLSYSQLTGFRSSSFGVNEPLTHTYFDPIEASPENYSSVSSLEGNQDLPFQSLQYVDLPVALNYQMSRSVGILMGLKMSYLLDTQMDGYVSAGLDDAGAALLDKALYDSMRKMDIATVLGISIYPTQNIGLEIKYNHGLIDYTKDQLWHIRQLNTNKTFELGLQYTLH